MPAPLTAKETCNFMSYTLEQLLGSNGLGLLGQYEIISGTTVLDTVDSIKVDYPLLESEVVRRFVPKSGIELVIRSEPSYTGNRFKFGNTQVIKFFTIIMDQHDPTGDLGGAIDAIYSNLVWDLNQPPTVFPSMLKPDHSGVLPPRAIMTLRQHKFLKVNW